MAFSYIASLLLATAVGQLSSAHPAHPAHPAAIPQTEHDGKPLAPVQPLQLTIPAYKSHPILPRQIAGFALEAMDKQEKQFSHVHFSNVASGKACRELCYQKEQLNCLGGVLQWNECSLSIMKERLKGAKTTEQCPLGVNPEAYFYVDDTPVFSFQGPCHKSDEEHDHSAQTLIERRSTTEDTNLHFDKTESKDACRDLCFKTPNCLRATHSQKTPDYGLDTQVGKCNLVITPKRLKHPKKSRECPFGTVANPDDVAKYGYFDHDGPVVYAYDGPCYNRRAWGINLHVNNVSSAAACRDLCTDPKQLNCLGGRWSMGAPPLAPANGSCALSINYMTPTQGKMNDFSHAPVTDQCPHGQLELHGQNVVDDSKDGPMSFSFIGPCYNVNLWNTPDLTRDAMPLWMTYGDGKKGMGTPTSCIEDGIPCPGSEYNT